MRMLTSQLYLHRIVQCIFQINFILYGDPFVLFVSNFCTITYHYFYIVFMIIQFLLNTYILIIKIQYTRSDDSM